MITFVVAIRFTSSFQRFKGFLSLGFLHFRVAFEYQKGMTTIEAAEARKMAIKPQYQLDETKRLSLQPANQLKVPQGWTEVRTSDPTKIRVSQVPITKPLEDSFVHDFFGSQLVIGDMRIGSGLPRKMHRLEITKDRLTIDNKTYEVNQGELERIKQLLRNRD